MTNQEAFDKVWRTFIVDGAPRSVDGINRCMYGAPGTTGCAVACLIKPEMRQAVHDWELKGEGVSGVHQLCIEFTPERLGLDGVDLGLLARFQFAHDESFMFSEAKVERLETIARDFGLTIPQKSAGTPQRPEGQ